MSQTILGISGSIRSKHTHLDALLTCIYTSKSKEELKKSISDTQILFANSDIALAFALFAARQEGADIDILSLRSFFSISSNNTQLVANSNIKKEKNLILTQRLNKAQGVIISTPTYFGDQSSLVGMFYEWAAENDLLKNKVMGSLSIGAKRNGGQETACIYTLMNALSQSAMAVGNGPSTSQYGGTVVAGNKAKALEDSWGLERCYEVGKKNTYTSQLISQGMASTLPAPALNICVLMTMDTAERKYHAIVDSYLEPLKNKHNVEIIELIQGNITSCLACDSCPKLGKSHDARQYHCIIKKEDDCIIKNYEKISRADLFIIVGVNSNDAIINRYQMFMERTRAIRRDDYQLSNNAIISLLVNEIQANVNKLHNIKVVTSYIRHNTILLPSLEVALFNSQKIYESNFDSVIAQAQTIVLGRKLINGAPTNYVADGYDEKS